MCKKLLSGDILHYKVGKVIIYKIKHDPRVYAGREDSGLVLSVERQNFINVLPGSSNIMINLICMFCIWVWNYADKTAYDFIDWY